MIIVETVNIALRSYNSLCNYVMINSKERIKVAYLQNLKVLLFDKVRDA